MMVSFKVVVPWVLFLLTGIALIASDYKGFKKQIVIDQCERKIATLVEGCGDPPQNREAAIQDIDTLAKRVSRIAPAAAVVLRTLQASMLAGVEVALADQSVKFSEQEIERLQELLGEQKQGL